MLLRLRLLNFGLLLHWTSDLWTPLKRSSRAMCLHLVPALEGYMNKFVTFILFCITKLKPSLKFVVLLVLLGNHPIRNRVGNPMNHLKKIIPPPATGLLCECTSPIPAHVSLCFFITLSPRLLCFDFHLLFPPLSPPSLRLTRPFMQHLCRSLLRLWSSMTCGRVNKEPLSRGTHFLLR